MIELEDFAATLTSVPDDWPSSDRVERVEPATASRNVSPSAAYALLACRKLSQPLPEALLCISGPTGSTVQAFDAAWKMAEGGALISPGFVRRSRKIHPLTLLRSIQNQVAAIVSMHLNIKGACLNVLESGLPNALINLQAMLSRNPRILVVMSSASFRLEEASKHRYLHGESGALEGAICFTVSGQNGLGTLLKGAQDGIDVIPATYVNVAPALTGGMEVIAALLKGQNKCSWRLGEGQHSVLSWKAAT